VAAGAGGEFWVVEVAVAAVRRVVGVERKVGGIADRAPDTVVVFAADNRAEVMLVGIRDAVGDEVRLAMPARPERVGILEVCFQRLAGETCEVAETLRSSEFFPWRAVAENDVACRLQGVAEAGPGCPAP